MALTNKKTATARYEAKPRAILCSSWDSVNDVCGMIKLSRKECKFGRTWKRKGPMDISKYAYTDYRIGNCLSLALGIGGQYSELLGS